MRRSVLTLTAAVLCTTPAVRSQLHFASIGNWGTGTATQESVARTLKSFAKPYQLTFLVSPGSNFIGTGGVESIDDSVWNLHFVRPYKGADLHIPFFTILGQADWQGNFTAQADRSFSEYNITAKAEGESAIPKWSLPNWWYHYTQHFTDASQANAASGGTDVSISFVFIDTFILSRDFPFQNITDLHWNALRDTLASAGKIFDWTVVVGDTALLSSGASKGNKELRDTLGKLLHDSSVDVYISGNDLDMEILSDGALSHINCGTGAAADRIYRTRMKDSVAYFARPGFCHHIVTKDSFTTQLVNGMDGNVLHSYTQQRTLRPRSVYDRFKLYKALPETTFIPIPPLEQNRPLESDWFIRVFGTIGMLVLVYLVFVLIATAAKKAQKEGNL